MRRWPYRAPMSQAENDEAALDMFRSADQPGWYGANSDPHVATMYTLHPAPPPPRLSFAREREIIVTRPLP
jgi:hypothetical protein